jgi:hypothetical protein
MNNPDIYRFDTRTKEEAIRDIKEGHRRQEMVVNGFARFWFNQFGEYPHIENNGCDNSGDYLEAHQVTADADILVNGHKVEIKTTQFKHHPPKELWLKKEHTDRLIRDGAHIIYAIGDFDSGNLFFTLIMNDELEQIAQNAEIDYPEKFGYRKAVYVVPTNDFKWAKLPQ